MESRNIPTVNELISRLEEADKFYGTETIIIQPPIEDMGDTDQESDVSDSELTGDVQHLPRRILQANATIAQPYEENEAEDPLEIPIISSTTLASTSRASFQKRKRSKNQVPVKEWSDVSEEVKFEIPLFEPVELPAYLNSDNCKEIVAYSENDTSLSSSVFCSNHKYNSKRCIFLNLCYNFHSNFMFLLSEKSIISGLDNKNDFKNIFPTSVLNHSALPLKISLMYANNFSNFKMYENEVFLLHRFKPDNIMHVVHDDILPLFTTYRDLCLGNVSECASKYDLLFSDENIYGSFLEWYRAFSKNEPFKLSTLNKSITYCFTKVNVGLSVDSVIFQYGFLQNRGPTHLSVNQVQLLEQFKTFMCTHFGINNYQTNSVVFISRKINRKILNEEYVENVVLKMFIRELKTSVRILNVDLSLNSSKEVLQAIAAASYLIGMHGAGMFLSFFLPQNSVVLEMFPYGINKELVSPLFVMSLIPGIWFRYFYWENAILLNSFPHPEYLPVLGGLSHLEREKQIEIFGKTGNISKECCDDPLFLSRMYQDTIVDDTLTKIISYSLKNLTKHLHDFSQIYMYEWFFPSVVRNITCYRNISNFILSWNRPINVDWSNKVYYDLSIQTPRHNLSVFTSTSFLNLQLDPDISTIKIWIKCNIPGIEGLDTFITC